MKRRSVFMLVLLLISTATAFTFGRGEIQPPAVSLDLPETTYLSPGNKDGVQDIVSWTVSITASERMVVKGYRILVADEGGTEVYRFEEFNPARQPIIFRFKRPVALPEQMTWDATTTDGDPVPEGRYTLRVEGVDDRDRTGGSAPYLVVVDNTRPWASASLPYSIFSPNADGNRDILIVEQTGSIEQIWEGTFLDSAGQSVFSRSWTGEAPENLVWDGVASDGALAPDGIYSYVLSSTDLAGNSYSTSVDDISINTLDTPISLSRDVGYFSPNGDGSVDTVNFTFDVPVTDDIREWTLEVSDATGSVRRTTGGQAIPAGFVFDGTGDNGRILPEGTYSARLSVEYLNGNNPTSEAPQFVLDVSPPTVFLTSETSVFSPNGDGRLDTVQIFQETSREEVWTGRVVDAAGRTILETDWRVQAEPKVTWDGRDSSGALVPDGEYRYVLSARDRAGNVAQGSVNSIRVDTRETPVSLTSDVSHFSPNGDKVRDTLSFLPSIPDTRGLVSLELIIVDTDGNVVRRFQRNSAVESIEWTGRNERNQPASDGSYQAQLSVRYENGNNPTATIGPLVIDRVVPTAQVGADAQIFSPDGDGSLDTVRISQTSASQEESWVGTFTNTAGEQVRVVQWSGTPESFVWDGTDADGNRIPDGTYRYTLGSTDRAGNTGQFVVDRIVVDTRPTPVSVRIGGAAFSPDGNGVKDTLEITPELEIADNVDTWTLQIVSGSGMVRRTFDGQGSVPESLAFDGTDETGSTLGEGSYTAVLSVLYRNGNRPTATSPIFDLDITQPVATVTTSSGLFSPNGDGRRDTVVLTQSGSSEELWTGRVSDATDDPVREFVWRAGLDAQIEWDGRDDNGRLVPDGEYTYSISSTDRAGNVGTSTAVDLRVDSRVATLGLTPSPAYFSPNADGVNDTVAFTPALAFADGVASYRLEILGEQGDTVRTIGGANTVPARLTWDGRTEDGSRAVDGTYKGYLTVEYEKGDMPTAETVPIALDTTAPAATVRAPQTIFSPEGDGRKDTITIEQETSTEVMWEAGIYAADGTLVREAFWSGAATNFEWDGKDDNGSVVPDGSYRYELRSTDRAGNSTSRSVPSIRVDTRATSAFVNPTVTAFTPNGDGSLDSVRLNLYPSLNEGVSRWSVTILDQAGRLNRDVASGNRRAVPSSVTWDGRNSAGQIVEGSFTAVLTVEYDKGNLVEAAAASPVLVDVSGPTFNLRVSPTPFSPDGDGENDVARIVVSSVADASTIAGWQIAVFDPYDRLFFERSGTGSPPVSLQWDGVSADGELVQAAEDYRLSATLTDSLGNTREQSVALPIDVLVISEGDVLKIRISSIQFAPNSAALVGSDPDVAARNMRTLNRLAEILRKYSAYQIRIEGHAVSEYWNNATRAAREEREELQPLSRDRADTVKSALVDLGIPASRMSTAGIGGRQPIVPHGDLDNRWKNRRVEFVLIR